MEFSQTVARALVHRAAIAEVFLTSATQLNDDNFHVAAQLPRQHAFYGETRGPRGNHDPMLFLEASRQACILITHQYCAVPMGNQFIIRDLDFKVTDPAGLAVRHAPANTLLDCRILRRFHGREGPAGLRVHCTSIVNGQPTATVEFSYSWVSTRQWDTIRAANRAELGLPKTPMPYPPPARITAHRVDRRDPYNVVISPLRLGTGGARHSTVIVDPTHPTMFDHPLDHLPGMLQLEAFRQLAIATAAETGITIRTGQLRAISARFLSFGELDLPNDCETLNDTTPSTNIKAKYAMNQGDRRIAEATLRLAPTKADLPSLSALGYPR